MQISTHKLFSRFPPVSTRSTPRKVIKVKQQKLEQLEPVEPLKPLEPLELLEPLEPLEPLAGFDEVGWFEKVGCQGWWVVTQHLIEPLQTLNFKP